MQLIQAPNIAVIAEENAVPISQLPHIWQDIAAGIAKVGLHNPHSYVEMAQLFQYKLSWGDVDLFNERPELADVKSAFSQLFAQLAHETLEFYGHDFLIDSYPNFTEIIQDLESKKKEHGDELKVAHIGGELFDEFGYQLPASFYHVHLGPIYRDHVFEERALRFDKRDIVHKRSWDAVLHAGKVFAIQMKVQSIASKYGFTYHHGCGCNSHLSSIDEASGEFNYKLTSEKSQRWIRSFIWTAWYEYAFFPIVPNTRYLV
ncbi:hypothetical protein [Umezakia ovalisporum]|jgi:hypothetical protein|uniref:Uncharacterized protein n=2 Tax=Umezakia ovalisporum TaxID=75695 RepID=A0AA43H045_9CYAN|nr:hypothetical protein [Umezakia ovalisporum]MBI1240938.1 hypothetical protein [Nostoc sp. RI_552]MDH6058075.1 hypothetical protein [Umezakia ovalisporum FSS-43]MDH6064711.1 hypothetical protein [Umezakia ovalisporum FSS-62]MDH6066684.1 hypothetical protein [Umezakia ovalisporum APH033B]MDH6071564.1 hypothetical protein [Umezakia ovalisporum CobakiLakeA]